MVQTRSWGWNLSDLFAVLGAAIGAAVMIAGVIACWKAGRLLWDFTRRSRSPEKPQANTALLHGLGICSLSLLCGLVFRAAAMLSPHHVWLSWYFDRTWLGIVGSGGSSLMFLVGFMVFLKGVRADIFRKANGSFNGVDTSRALRTAGRVARTVVGMT